MDRVLLIPAYNDVSVTSTANATFSPAVGDVFAKKTNLNKDNNSGLLFVRQLAGGNANAGCQIWGSIDGTNYSPLITGIAFTTANGGTSQSLAYPVALPPFIKLRLTNRAHTTTVEASGVEVHVTF